MKILIYSLIFLSGGLGLITGLLSILLGAIFLKSPLDSDTLWGWAIISFGIFYAVHPFFVYWLYERNLEVTSILVCLFFISFSLISIFFLSSFIEVAARP